MIVWGLTTTQLFFFSKPNEFIACKHRKAIEIRCPAKSWSVSSLYPAPASYLVLVVWRLGGGGVDWRGQCSSVRVSDRAALLRKSGPLFRR